MARRLVERNFDPKLAVVARRSFNASGRHYGPGDTFDWRHLAVDQRRVRQMFDSGFLRHFEEEVDVPSPAPVAPKPVIEPVFEPVVADEQGDELDAIDDMKELRAIADAEGAPYKVSKADQREAIRENRKSESELD